MIFWQIYDKSCLAHGATCLTNICPKMIGTFVPVWRHVTNLDWHIVWDFWQTYDKSSIMIACQLRTINIHFDRIICQNMLANCGGLSHILTFLWCRIVWYCLQFMTSLVLARSVVFFTQLWEILQGTYLDKSWLADDYNIFDSNTHAVVVNANRSQHLPLRNY